MKAILVLIGTLIATVSYGSATDSLNKNTPIVSGRILLTNNAFAPIPAFSFDNPAAMFFLTVQGKRLRYEPDFSIGLNGKPWMWNNWFRYNVVRLKSHTFNLGLNPGLFFIENRSITGESTIGSNRNLTGEGQVKSTFSNRIRAILIYRYNKAFDKGTLDGHSIDLAVEFTRVVSIKKLRINLRPQTFYFNSEEIFKGWYVASSVSLSYGKMPVLVSYQAVQSIWTNYLPQPRYLSNFSLIYLF